MLGFRTFSHTKNEKDALAKSDAINSELSIRAILCQTEITGIINVSILLAITKGWVTHLNFVILH